MLGSINFRKCEFTPGKCPAFFVFSFAFSRTCNNTCKYACNCTCIYTCEMYSYENKEKLLTPYILITEPLFTRLKLALISRLNFLSQLRSAPTTPQAARQSAFQAPPPPPALLLLLSSLYSLPLAVCGLPRMCSGPSVHGRNEPEKMTISQNIFQEKC